jgi:predicted dithiol-disulfide oxidoreductase (DUF899 family)
MATRYCVEWMTKVPESGDGSRYDEADWSFKTFGGSSAPTSNAAHIAARKFAAETASSNQWRQAWLYVDRAPNERSPEWQWERDHDETEIFEA